MQLVAARKQAGKVRRSVCKASCKQFRGVPKDPAATTIYTYSCAATPECGVHTAKQLYPARKVACESSQSRWLSPVNGRAAM